MQYLTVYPLPGFAHAYLDINIGVENIDPVRSITTYADMNIGLAPFDESDAVAYLDFNVGLEPKPRNGAEYLDLNVIPRMGAYEPATYMDINVTSDTPTPHIWYVQPQIGPEGLMFRIVGQGFGVSQGEFNGKVVLSGIECPIVSWSAIPESASQVVRITRASMGDFSGSASNITLKPGITFPNAYVFTEGDTLEYEYRRIAPDTYLPGEFYWTPYFRLINSGGSIGAPNMTLWNDEYGNIIDRPDVPVGEVIKRSFPVPSVFYSQSTQRGTNWGFTWQGGTTADRPAHSVEIRNMMIRGADGVPKFWILGEDGSAVTLPGSTELAINLGITSSAFDAFIEYGATNKAHQEILALVPDGAESGMVQVILEA
jgi:hypothetical protein